MGKIQGSLNEERRRQDALILIDRRKGKLVVIGQTVLFVGLTATLVWLTLS